jgi:hypothetical protein
MAKIHVNKKYYLSDFTARIGSIEDFLALSEHTLDWQFRVERQRIQHLDAKQFPIPEDIIDHCSYRNHFIEKAEERFTVDLPVFLRHTALMALTSAVETASTDLKKFTEANFNQVKGKKDPVTIMRIFNERFSLGEDKLLTDFRHLVTVRHFIVHNRRDRKYNLDDAVRALGPHFRIGIMLWRGEQVFIDRGGLDPHLSRMKDFIPKLCEDAARNGLWASRSA